ncbi:MAG TPA: PH domain-containing protein [Allosphingosinicella sp.]|jgi:hypothetical protein
MTGTKLISLERGQLWLMRVHAAGAALVILAAAAIGETVLADRFELPRGILLLPLLLPVLYFVLLAPGRRYRAWGYGMAEDELEVRRGVWTQIHTVVPLERIQHIDVAQGPLERAFGVCRLILHTAGTLHSQVLVPGLSRADAERMRDEIRGRIREEPA